MKTFLYKAIDSNGSTTTGSLEANDQPEAIAKLKKLRLSPVTISQATVKSSGKVVFGRKTITRSDISNFTRVLRLLLKAKMPLAKALESIEKQSDKESVRHLVSKIHAKVLEGTSLSDALTTYPKHFNALYINLTKLER